MTEAFDPFGSNGFAFNLPSAYIRGRAVWVLGSPTTLLETTVCDLILAGWVFLRSRRWKALIRDCQQLIHKQLALQYAGGRTSPRYIACFGFCPRLNYKRRVPRGIQVGFDLDFETRRNQREEARQRQLDAYHANPWSVFFGLPVSVRESDTWETFSIPRSYSHHSAREPTRDRSNRDALGRVLRVKEYPKKSKPKNVMWQRGKQTRRRWKGK